MNIEEISQTIFLNNKYSNWYFKIIENAKAVRRHKLPKNDPGYQYYEEHHIIPKSILKNNETVLLTSREHYLCHALLCKMTYGKNKYKMLNAFHAFDMVNNKNHHQRKFNSRLFEYFRIEWAKNSCGENNPNYGNKWSQEQKEHLRNFRTGKKANEKTKQIWSIQRTGRRWFNDGVNEFFIFESEKTDKMFEGRLTIFFSEEINNRRSETLKNIYKQKQHHRKGKIPWNKGLKLK